MRSREAHQRLFSVANEMTSGEHSSIALKNTDQHLVMGHDSNLPCSNVSIRLLGSSRILIEACEGFHARNLA